MGEFAIYIYISLCLQIYFLAVLKTIFNFVLGPPAPRGVPGEGPDYHLLQEVGRFGSIPARIREVMGF